MTKRETAIEKRVMHDHVGHHSTYHTAAQSDPRPRIGQGHICTLVAELHGQAATIEERLKEHANALSAVLGPEVASACASDRRHEDGSNLAVHLDELRTRLKNIELILVSITDRLQV